MDLFAKEKAQENLRRKIVKTPNGWYLVKRTLQGGRVNKIGDKKWCVLVLVEGAYPVDAGYFETKDEADDYLDQLVAAIEEVC